METAVDSQSRPNPSGPASLGLNAGDSRPSRPQPRLRKLDEFSRLRGQLTPAGPFERGAGYLFDADVQAVR